MTMDCEVSGMNKYVILRLTAEEAALLANDCKSLADAVGEDYTTIELKLRRLSDRAEGKI